jgi:predicted phage terminase large subunit-like protein
VKCAIECNGTQLGYFQDIQADPKMSRRTVIEDKPEGNKEMRAGMWGSRLCDGIIHCVRGEWNSALFDEMDAFPNGTHDDQVDAISGGYNLVAIGRSEYEAVDVMKKRRERGVFA